MLLVQKEIAEEQTFMQNNASKRKALEDPALKDAPVPESSAKKVKPEVESDSENEEFFDAASEFTHVSLESAAAPQVEKPIGPIDTGYKKVNKQFFKKETKRILRHVFRLSISEIRHTLLLLLLSETCLSVESVRNTVLTSLVVRWL